MANLAVIPARAGSKRIPQKNIRKFFGKPIMSYSIEVAKETGLFDEIMVSTDSDEIASLALSLDINVPFKRTGKAADDFATLTDVLLEVISEYRNMDKYFEFVCLILPTAVFVSSQKLKEAYLKLRDNPRLSGALPVVQFPHPVQRSFTIDESSELKLLYPGNINVRTQDLPHAYYDSGQFYWLRTKDFLAEKKIFMEHLGAIELSALEVQDIDTEEDWRIAELKYSLLYR